jgi:hypothetical protein
MSDDAFSRFELDFELFVSAEAAELEALRTIVQMLLVSLLSSHPQGAMLFSELRTNALARLDREAKVAAHDQDVMHKAEIVLQNATRIFDEMASAFDLTPDGSSEPQH